MPDNDPSIIEQFEEFLAQKEANAKAQKEDEDEEVEIWDESGKGARVRRSRAKPFLQSLGIDLDPEPASESGGGSDDNPTDKGKTSSRRSTGKTAASGPATGVARKYFVKGTGK